jgi:membrane associated rhomboid family serine protease
MNFFGIGKTNIWPLRISRHDDWDDKRWKDDPRWDGDKKSGSSWRDRSTVDIPITATGAIIAACVMVFLLTFVLPGFVYPYLALSSQTVMERPWTIVTHMFVHANVGHLFWNMLALFFFGTDLERKVGQRQFLIIYLASGIVAGIFQMVFTTGYGVGASGAILGVMGCLAVIAPEISIVIFPIPIPMGIRLATVLFAAISFFNQLGLNIGGDNNVGYVAHLTGIVVGVAFGYMLKGQQRRYHSY